MMNEGATRYDGAAVKRRMFNLAGGAAAVSLVLCVATTVMWVRSGSRFEGVSYTSPYDASLSRRRWTP